MRHAQVSWHRCFIHSEAVVLRGDHHRVVVDIFHRVVTTVVAKLHLDGVRSARQRQQLMAETDAEYRDVGFRKDLMASIA